MPVNSWTLFWAFIFFVLSTVSGLNPQGEALIAWKRTLKGSLEALSNWDTTDDTPCEWFGLACNFNKEVVELNLKYMDLLGNVPSNFSSLASLKKLVLSETNLSGSIPEEIGILQELTYLDLSDNALTGEIPDEICHLPKLEQLLLNTNRLEGSIPAAIGNLTSLMSLIIYDNQLGVLDLSYNQLSGDLHYLTELQNLVVLNVSNNQFSGHVPETSFFAKLPLSVLAGNPELCFSGNACSADKVGATKHAARVAMVVLLSTACVLLLAALYIILGGKMRGRGAHNSDLDSVGDVELGPPWEVTVYQKLDFSIVDVTKCLTAVNVIGRGRSGIVYRANIPSGLVIAVKRFRVSEKCSASTFSSEITTLARIRHRNIVRLLGWAANRSTKLLFYDYMPNGTLGSLLHEGCGGVLEWETRFNVALGVAEGLAYLHHDCVPPILHRDVKAHNILLGDRYEPCMADFGLARFIEEENASFSANPQFAGSYGYFAPEYACMVKITEKSDVYSYGVVLLEIITGKKPVDPSFPDEQHVIQWVRDHLKSRKNPVDIIDQKLQGNPDTQIQEILQGLGIALLCTSNRAEDRPTMKDVVALLKEIRHEQTTVSESHKTASISSKISKVPSNSSPSVTPAQLLVQGSSNCSFTYSSSSASYNTVHQ
ncbi:LRR receptor-like serine/threonine-protein kinase [Olea europaea var. sylvestris]|uniref:LRR receptor-like serine/threonine-protein kinase n=1 Tax=Olea europaea var. sylvestris TaxID=158386 RepID=UPI000C1D0440|nr:LRR receptor-like serine/threonine-protein kinase [Olea europaea var. sylvestris]